MNYEQEKNNTEKQTKLGILISLYNALQPPQPQPKGTGINPSAKTDELTNTNIKNIFANRTRYKLLYKKYKDGKIFKSEKKTLKKLHEKYIKAKKTLRNLQTKQLNHTISATDLLRYMSLMIEYKAQKALDASKP